MTVQRRPKPLKGLRVLVPRGGEWGNSIASSLRLEGAAPVVAPMINFASAQKPEVLADAFARLQAGAFDWLIVSSATTVDVLSSHGVRIPAHTRIAAIGETTSSALTIAGYRVDFIPMQDNSAHGLLRAWRTQRPSGTVLVPQSAAPDHNLAPGLAQLQLDAEFVTAYRTIGVSVAESVVEDTASGRIGAVLVTSGSVAEQMKLQLHPLPERTVVAAIGPRTAFDARAQGIRVDVIAETRTAKALVEALVEHGWERSA